MSYAKPAGHGMLNVAVALLLREQGVSFVYVQTYVLKRVLGMQSWDACLRTESVLVSSLCV